MKVQFRCRNRNIRDVLSDFLVLFKIAQIMLSALSYIYAPQLNKAGVVCYRQETGG